MFVKSQTTVSRRSRGRGFCRIDESEVPRIGSAHKPVGKSIKSIGVIDQAIRLSNLGNDRLILGSLGCLIHSFFPTLKTLLPFFDLLNKLFVFRVNRFLRSRRGR